MNKTSKESQTQQEIFWSGEFGDEYSERNTGEGWIASNLALFSKILQNLSNVSSLIEFGANRGLNLIALRKLLPEVDFSAIEINNKAADILKTSVQQLTVHQQSILDFKPQKKYDFVLSKGVLIHINPDALPEVYDVMAESSQRYICIAEYYSPSPQEIPYRGHEGFLFKRDFAGELMERHPEFTLKDYGFVYRKDPLFPQDDITWFLLEKQT